MHAFRAFCARPTPHFIIKSRDKPPCEDLDEDQGATGVSFQHASEMLRRAYLCFASREFQLGALSGQRSDRYSICKHEIDRGNASMTSRAPAWTMVVTLLLAAAYLMPAQPVSAQPSVMFAKLKGAWRGRGSVAFRNGNKQRISCRGYYTIKAGGSTLGLAIRCAARDNKIELRARVLDSRGRLSGTWEERTFNATGDISGSAKPGLIRISISGPITGSMRIAFDAKGQRVAISTATTELKNISITMRR